MDETKQKYDTPQDGKTDPAFDNESPGALSPGLSSILADKPDTVVNKHHHWTRTITRAVEALLFQPECAIVVLAGPTGVGKTTALRTIVRRIIEQKREELRDAAIVPVGYAEVPMSGTRKTRWKETLRDVLLSLQAQLRARKQRANRHAIKVSPSDQPFFDLEATLLARSPYVVILDEFHNLVWGKGDQTEENALIRLRSLANRSKTKFLLVGTVKLLRGLNSNPETGRRTELVLFQRYRADDADDIRDFRDVLSLFEDDLGDRLKWKPSSDLAYAYHGCAGCVGILADWFAAASARAGKGDITEKVFNAARKSGAKLKQFDEDARAFESHLEQSEVDEAILLEEIRQKMKNPLPKMEKSKRK